MRRVIRQREIVADDWRYAHEVGDGDAAGLIVPFERWRTEREDLRGAAYRLGVQIGPTDPLEVLAGDFDRLTLIAIEFGGIGEGRGYSQAQRLRGRYGFSGELRAIGRVSQDQIWFLARSGFDAFELTDEAQLDAALAALERFSVAYQAAPDRVVRPQRRRDGTVVRRP